MVSRACEVVADVRRQALVQTPAQIQAPRRLRLLLGLRGAERLGGVAARRAELVRRPLQRAAGAGNREVPAAASFSPAGTVLANDVLCKPISGALAVLSRRQLHLQHLCSSAYGLR